MVTAVVAACAVLAAGVLAVLAVHRSRRESERQLEIAFERVSSHLDALSTSVEQAVARMVDAQRDRSQPLSLDFDALVDALVAEAAARTGADAVVLRVEGPGGRPVLASLGAGTESELAERAFAPPDARPFRAATIDWTYSASGEADDEGFRSALVAPMAASTGIPGTLVAYSSTSHAFRTEHASALHGLVAEFGTGLANARRFADVEARLLLDPTTGVASRRGYEVELGREVARAHRTGRPLSVVLVGINGTETATTGGNESVDEVARLLTRVTRKSDISCRRGDREFAILMPETRASGAHVLTTRLREEAKRALGQSPTTIAVGHVEWRPDEPVEELEARVDAALTPERRAGPSKRHLTDSAPPRDLDGGRAETLRRDALDTLGRELAKARRHGESLAVLVVGLEGLDELSQRIDRESADAALSRVAQQLSEGVGNGFVHRLGPGEFALVLAGATVDDAEALIGALHHADDGDRIDGITLSAGITELAERDDAQSALGRAEHALWQAKQAGPGTIVVAVPGGRTPR